jgi:hypothetical protein
VSNALAVWSILVLYSVMAVIRSGR